METHGNFPTLMNATNALKSVKMQLLAEKPAREELLDNVHSLTTRINSSELEATKDRLARIEKEFNDKGRRQRCSFT